VRDSSHLYFPDRKTSAISSNIENNALDLATAASQRGQTLATPIWAAATIAALAGLTTAVAVYYSSREMAL
jgi:hypothetical protein